MEHTRSDNRETRYNRYLHPRWWPTWAMIGLLWLTAHLPVGLQWWLGRRIGDLVWLIGSERRHITEVNIRLCFPELSTQEQKLLVRKSFRANGIGVMELGIAWFRSPKVFLPVTRVNGLHHIDTALAEGKGVLLLGGHYSTLDLGGSLATEFISIDVMQRDHDNPLMNAVMTRARERHYSHVLGSKNLRGLLRQLKKNRIVWYATDQDYGRKDIVFAPFFDIPAGTITATARIARRSGCKVVPMSHFRREDKPGYDIYFLPPLDDFPSGDDLADATRLNRIIENEVRRHPDQYLWMHRRFKTRPSRASANFYKKESG